FTNQQQVTIEGATTTQFSYGYNTNQLYVNSLPGTNTAALETFAELMEADAAGEIQITVASDDGSGFYGLAGLAIRLVETLPSGPFIVNTTADTIDVNPGDGIAEDASGNTSLRAAIMEANALAGANEIIVPAGTYTLSIAGIWESAAATGDLDILDDLIITGDGQGLTIINGAGIDRVFDIALSVNVQFHDLRITGGQAIGDSSHVLEDRGGGIRI